MYLDFDNYEIDNILTALNLLHGEELKKGKWEMQPNSKQYYYSPTKKSKQIQFTINNIKRQMEKNIVIEQELFKGF